jgi:hypothetical protein
VVRHAAKHHATDDEADDGDPQHEVAVRHLVSATRLRAE